MEIWPSLSVTLDSDLVLIEKHYYISLLCGLEVFFLWYKGESFKGKREKSQAVFKMSVEALWPDFAHIIGLALENKSDYIAFVSMVSKR